MSRFLRIVAALCVAVSLLVGLGPLPSSAAAPQDVGYWSRRLPFQGDQQVEGQSVGQAVRFQGFGSAAAPQQLPPPPVDTTLPDQDDPVPDSGPVTTVPLPVPVPTIPDPPVTLPDDGGPGAPNPGVPEGGLWVANDPTGPVAISALRYRGDIGSGELTLRFASGSTTVGPVIACPALSTFEPVAGGAWRDRPAHDCDRLSLTGRLTTDGSGLSFTIPQGFLPFGERVLDIVVLPARTAGDPFSLYFEPPGEDSFEVFSGQMLPPEEAELPEVDPLTLPTTPPPVESPSFDGGVSAPIDAPVLEVPETTPTEPSEEAAPLPQPVAEVFEPFTESRAGRILAMVILLAMGGGLWWLSGQPIRQPRLLGALGGGAVPVVATTSETGRGIGRFRRERTAPPNRL